VLKVSKTKLKAFLMTKIQMKIFFSIIILFSFLFKMKMAELEASRAVDVDRVMDKERWKYKPPSTLGISKLCILKVSSASFTK